MYSLRADSAISLSERKPQLIAYDMCAKPVVYTLSPQSQDTLHEPHWTPLQTWNPVSESWALSSLPVPPLARNTPFGHFGRFYSHSSKSWYTRVCCVKLVLVALLASLVFSFALAWGLHMAPNSFNGDLGARGIYNCVQDVYS